MIVLSKQLKEDLITIDPYYTLKKEAELFDVCVNTMIKLRGYADLKEKDKGRPLNTGVVFKGDEQYPKEVVKAVERIKQNIRKHRTKAALLKKEKNESNRNSK